MKIENKIIKVCADPFPPYQYIDESGRMRGKDYDFVIECLRQAGYSPLVTIAPWSEIYEAFENGEQDVLFQVQDSPERVEKYYFSTILRYAVTEIITLHSNLAEIKDYKSLENYKLGVIRGFANGANIDDLKKSCKVEYQDTEELLEAIENGEVDCGVCDSGVKKFLLKEEGKFYIMSALTYQRPLYVMFNKKCLRDDFESVRK